jgi:hypothetical protein
MAIIAITIAYFVSFEVYFINLLLVNIINVFLVHFIHLFFVHFNVFLVHFINLFPVTSLPFLPNLNDLITMALTLVYSNYFKK